MEAGNLEEACASFAESYRLDAAVGTLLNQARCEELRGRLADAWEHYQAAVELLGASDGRRTVAQERVAALETRVPRLTLRLKAPPPGVRVLRDQVELREASLGMALPLNPGPHVIEVHAPDRAPRLYRLQIAEGERKELTLDPGPRKVPGASSASGVPAAPGAPVASGGPLTPLPTPRPAPAGGAARTAGWVAGGIGAAALLTSLGVGLWALERRQVVRDRCPGNQCDAEGLQAGGELKALSRVSSGALLLGALGLGSGAYLLVSGRF
jgi:hypothetical protein